MLSGPIALEAMLNHVRAWRLKGLSVGLANGCFDRFHAGHLWLIYTARMRVNRLCVALNSDKGVKRLKGKDRPRDGEYVRANACLMAGADAVAVFDDDTPAELIAAIQPDVLFKGGDYEGKDIVGAQYARELVLVPTLEGYSTTDMLKEEKRGTRKTREG